MTDAEFAEKMRNFGWANDYIDEIIRSKEEAAKEGIAMSLEVHLFEAPREGRGKVQVGGD